MLKAIPGADPALDDPPAEDARSGLLDTPLDRLPLPTRLTTWSLRVGARTVRDAVLLGREGLLQERNLGRTTIAAFDLLLSRRGAGDGLDTLHAHVVGSMERGCLAVARGDSPARPAVELPPFPIERYASFDEMWRELVAGLPPLDRLVISRRSGTTSEVETLEAIGRTLGVTRERVRQIQRRAFDALQRDGRWIDALSSHLESTLAGRAMTLDELSCAPFWRWAVEDFGRIRYLIDHFLNPRFSYARWDGSWLIAPGVVKEPDGAFQAFVRRPERPLPVTFETVRAQAREAGETACPGCGPLFEARVDGAFLLSEDRSTVVGVGSTKQAQLRAYLIERGEPVPVTELEARFGRFARAPDHVYVERGLLALSSTIEGFDEWKKKLVPRCVHIVRKRGPELQWMAGDLLDALRETGEVPDFLTVWLLSGMLRRSKGLVNLGRLRFSLPGVGDGQRIQFVPTLTRFVEEAGVPLERSELHARLSLETGFNNLTFNLALVHLPLLPIDPLRIGLLDRDVYGGRDAMLEACERLEAELARRDRGLSYGRALEFLRSESDLFESWTTEMVAAPPRMSSALVSNRSGIGLAEWGSVRVPSRNEIIGKLIRDGNGEASVQDIIDTIQHVHARTTKRSSLASLANQLGFRMDGGRVFSNVNGAHHP